MPPGALACAGSLQVPPPLLLAVIHTSSLKAPLFPSSVVCSQVT